jgi:DNA-binding phage protein
MRILETEDILQLLRKEIAKVGSQAAWAKKFGIERTVINKALHENKRPPARIISALGLRIVVVSDD